MSELSPRDRRYQRTQQAILDAALQIISKEGVEALSVRVIADKICYSPAGLYEYYGGREEIIRALCAQGHRQLCTLLERIDRDLPVEDYLVAISNAYVGFAVQNPHYFMLMFGAPYAQTVSSVSTGASAKQQERPQESLFAVFCDIIKHCVIPDSLQANPETDVTAMAFAVWSIVHGIALLRITHALTHEQNFDKLVRDALHTLNQGLTSR